MANLRDPHLAFVVGAVAVTVLAGVAGAVNGPAMAERLAQRASEAIAQAGGEPVEAHFETAGMPSRHPLLTGGQGLDMALRDRIAKTVAAVPGVGGIRWSDGTALVESASSEQLRPLHCQDDVEALLRARTIRFEESSARIDAASRQLLDEVATALRPCLGAIIAITGHTDSSGSEAINMELSRQRAEAVREALIARGIPDDGLRARGVGSSVPVPGLAPSDPANRRIDFSVVATTAIRPTPVDTPGPR